MISPQNDSKHPDRRLKQFWQLVNSVDVVQRAALNNGMRDFPLRRRPKKDAILDDELQATEICVYHSVKIKVGDGFWVDHWVAFGRAT